MRPIAIVQWSLLFITLFMIAWAFLLPVSSITGFAVITPKYPIHWMSPPAKTCVFKEYPFKTIYGLEYTKWDGSIGCYIPRSNHRQEQTTTPGEENPCLLDPCAPGCLPRCLPPPPPDGDRG